MKNIYCIIVYIFLSSCTDKTVRNSKNIGRVKEGMSATEVMAIMGKENREFEKDSDEFSLEYDAGFGSSDNYYVYFSKHDSLVIGVNRGD